MHAPSVCGVWRGPQRVLAVASWRSFLQMRNVEASIVSIVMVSLQHEVAWQAIQFGQVRRGIRLFIDDLHELAHAAVVLSMRVRSCDLRTHERLSFCLDLVSGCVSRAFFSFDVFSRALVRKST